jgi:hypothetical protein
MGSPSFPPKKSLFCTTKSPPLQVLVQSFPCIAWSNAKWSLAMLLFWRFACGNLQWVFPNPYGLSVKVFLGNIGDLWLLFATVLLKSAVVHGKNWWLAKVAVKSLPKQRKLS